MFMVVDDSAISLTKSCCVTKCSNLVVHVDMHVTILLSNAYLIYICIGYTPRCTSLCDLHY